MKFKDKIRKPIFLPPDLHKEIESLKPKLKVKRMNDVYLYVLAKGLESIK